MKLITSLLILLLTLPLKAVEVKDIDKAMIYIMAKGLISHKIHPWPNHPLLKNHGRRLELAQAINNASEKYQIPPYLMVAIAFRENSFTQTRTGAIGELSAFQMLPRIARIVRKIEPQCSLNTQKGSALCAAAWLSVWFKKCGSWEGALSIYASGRSCKPDTDRLKWLTKDRINIAIKLHKKFH
jgi:hypothetical protein